MESCRICQTSLRTPQPSENGPAMDTSVTHISSAHPPFDIRIYQKECKSLAAAGYKVNLVVSHDKDEERDGVLLLGLTRRTNRMSRMVLGSISALLRALGTGAKVYHLHDPELLGIGLLLKLLGKRVIYDAHEDVPRQVLSKKWIRPAVRQLVARMVEAFENFATRRFDAVVAATPHIAKRFSSINARTVTVNNFPSLREMFVPTGWDNKERAVCYIGAISIARGIREMLDAMADCDATLHLAGMLSSPELLQEFEGLAASGKRVVYHGVLDREGVLELLRRCRVGVVCFHSEPNHLHSQPTKLFEYMSAGIPVVASNFAYWREFVERNRCGICVDPQDSAEIARAINYALSHPDEAHEMGLNGRALVENNYTWEREEKKLLALYLHICNQ
jgi:glycosyltransferase involved in cell wall biosynthesis